MRTISEIIKLRKVKAAISVVLTAFLDRRGTIKRIATVLAFVLFMFVWLFIGAMAAKHLGG